MGRFHRFGWLLALCAGGCMTGPRSENPLLLGTAPGPGIENPVLIAPGEPGPHAYAEVFEKAIDVLDDYFPIAYANRYDGRIETHPRVAPGIIQLWRPGSPSTRERLEATLQTIRYRANLQIQAAAQGGYLVHVTVLKELLDRPTPLMARGGGASFREASTVERQFEVVDVDIDAALYNRWIPKGRECHIEQEILWKLRECQ